MLFELLFRKIVVLFLFFLFVAYTLSSPKLGFGSEKLKQFGFSLTLHTLSSPKLGFGSEKLKQVWLFAHLALTLRSWDR